MDTVIIHSCPQCKKSHYRVLDRTSTLMAWYPEYKDGLLVNKDPNYTIVHCECLECGKKFGFKE